jgi:hypothetical protein
LPALLKRSL